MHRRHFLRPALALPLLLAACSTPPADLPLELTKPSAQRQFQVELLPPVPAPTIGPLHSWTLRLQRADGQPVRGAQIRVDGGMPQHGHGLPTQPRVTRELEPGRYLIEGMKFSMSGWWELRLTISADGVDDRVSFNLVLTDSGLQR